MNTIKIESYNFQVIYKTLPFSYLIFLKIKFTQVIKTNYIATSLKSAPLLIL